MLVMMALKINFSTKQARTKMKRPSKKLLLLSIMCSFFALYNSYAQEDENDKSREEEKEQKQAEVSLVPSNPDRISDVWVNWDVYPGLPGMANLAAIRDRLNKNNLVSAYRELPDTLHGQDVVCGEEELRVRTDDGTCNSLEYPAMGAARMAFGRNVPIAGVVEDGSEKIMEPSPHLISRKLLRRNPDNFKAVPFLNLLAVNWLQYMNHDWFFHGKNTDENPYKMHTEQDNSQGLVPGKSTAINIPRTQPADAELRSQAVPELSPNKVFHNDVTHWWDGSQLYGSNSERVQALRLFEGGKLKLDQKTGLLPINPDDGMEEVGFKDNWWVGLSLFHDLFTREHNAIAAALAEAHPEYDDERLYDTARLINAAVMAKIHTVEWTPAILPNKTLNWGMHTNWYGAINPEAIRLISENMAGDDNFFLFDDHVPPYLKALRQQFAGGLAGLLTGIPAQANPNYPGVETLADLGGASMALITGMIGAKRELFEVPYAITEEFVAVYRMHPLLPEELNIRNTATDAVVETVAINDTRHEKAMSLISEHGMDSVFYSFGRSHPGSLTLRNYPAFMTDMMEVPENPEHSKKVDMAALEIIRDRERGIPRYNNFRRLIGLNPIRKFEDLFVDENRPETYSNLDSPEAKDLLQNLKTIYGDDVEKLDLLVGTLGENIRPGNFGFGETAFQIFILMATRRLQADRFYTDYYNSETYTERGLQWVDQATFKSVLLRHYPDLAPSLEGVENAFNPWNAAVATPDAPEGA